MNETLGIVATLIGSGGFVGWYREKRKAKKDVQGFALDFMKTQTDRIDHLVSEVADLKAQYNRVVEDNEKLRTENHDLRNKLAVKELLLEEAKLKINTMEKK